MAEGAVRPATRRDLDRVAALWSLLMEHHGRLDPHYRLRPGAESEFRRYASRRLDDPDVGLFVWEQDDDLLGFCLAQVESAPPLLPERARAVITDLLVRGEARRRGIGRALAEAGRAWARQRGVERLEVRVAVANVEGQAFWRALDFEPFVDVMQHRL
jgi:GNAT superfamily N-acetyltransferase